MSYIWRSTSIDYRTELSNVYLETFSENSLWLMAYGLWLMPMAWAYAICHLSYATICDMISDMPDMPICYTPRILLKFSTQLPN